jgi:hypothetical protein
VLGNPDRPSFFTSAIAGLMIRRVIRAIIVIEMLNNFFIIVKLILSFEIKVYRS